MSDDESQWRELRWAARTSVRSSGWGGSSMATRCGRDEGGWQLVSDNPAYKPLPWPPEAVVLGQAMWTGRTL